MAMQVTTSAQLVQRSGLSWRTALGSVLRVVLATAVLFICLSVAAQIVGVAARKTDADPATALMGLLGMCFLYAMALSYAILKSRWSGVKLVGAVFLAYAGVTPILLQSETVLFMLFLVPIVPPELVPSLFLNGFLTAALATPLLVLALGKARGGGRGQAATVPAGPSSVTEWVCKLGLIAVAYNAIYFTFGNLVAVPLAGEAFGGFYRDLQLPMWMPLFQAARGIFWALVMVPVLRMVKGSWWEAGLAVALLSAFLSAAPLFIPNAFMPDSMRFAHFFELLTSNFLFGWAIAWVLGRHHSSWRNVLGLMKA
jgi:hypothetical protein